MRQKGLGRGLDALLAASSESNGNETQRSLPVARLQAGKYQPRTRMDQGSLEELAASIRTRGLMQPILVRPLNDGEERYEIIAGERRWRAAQMAGLEEVPTLIREIPDEAALAMALIENIQREDLNAIEEAAALLRLMQEFELTHQEVAEAVGKSRSAVSNLLRLNQLNDDVKRLVEHGDLDMGHARALLGLEGALQTELARQVAQKGMTVRDTEKMVQRLLAPREERPAVEPPPLLASWESRVSERLGIPAKFVSSGKEKGKLVISFQNQADLDKILRYFELS